MQGRFKINKILIDPYFHLISGDASYPTLPPVYNTWLTLDQSWFSPETSPATTVQPRSGWYYEDDLGKIQGPFSNKMMRIWEKQGYFK